VFKQEKIGSNAGATHEVGGNMYHEFYQLPDGTPVGKLGAKHYLMDEQGNKLVE